MLSLKSIVLQVNWKTTKFCKFQKNWPIPPNLFRINCAIFQNTYFLVLIPETKVLTKNFTHLKWWNDFVKNVFKFSAIVQHSILKWAFFFFKTFFLLIKPEIDDSGKIFYYDINCTVFWRWFISNNVMFFLVLLP